MKYIRANNEGVIQIISSIEIEDYTCIVYELPSDFDMYLSESKYLANNTGLYISDGWIDFTNEDIEHRDFCIINDLKYDRYRYFIIPCEIVPLLKNYENLVYKALSDQIFDHVISRDSVSVEGEEVFLPTKIIKFIPCCSREFTYEGISVLDSVVRIWNNTYPERQIDFSIKFQYLSDYLAFVNKQ